ncbi:putative lactoylglutathione lyase [Prosthecobacter fusiformis]|uniref:Putative lactoylglutathione lyase n=1 Tax=Prosthecobacter fusiformis TaxID=48464 RepID=A0A4R7RI89_9BACT|nr:VOC family protein [Prosthecobacter fusiformis]TDU62572.1 putative lactoylglutathione lyase [Prosthecobacter fusiformis]
MIDHIIITVSNLSASLEFYQKALAPLGYSATPEYTSSTGTKGVGFGIKGGLDFFIQEGAAQVTQCHIAFTASTRVQVEEFYAAGLAAGGRDNGKPELTPDHGPDYYSAYVFDPDGCNIEAVCTEPEA